MVWSWFLDKASPWQGEVPRRGGEVENKVKYERKNAYQCEEFASEYDEGRTAFVV